MSQLKDTFERLRHFFLDEIWTIRISEQSQRKRYWLVPLKVVAMVVRGLLRNDIYKTASSLTYYSLLSIVPTVALAFGIAKGFGLQKFMKKQIYSIFEGHEEIADQVLRFSDRMIDNTSGGAIAGVGLVFLLATIIILLNRIETSLNEIWMVEKSRGLIRKLTENITIIFLAPIIVILTAGANVAITNELDALMESSGFLHYFNPGFQLLLRVIPLVLIGVLFTVIYIIFPNTNVKMLPGLMAGFIAGFIYLLVQNIYVGFQVGVSNYNAVYGSFASFPLFLIWVNLSWVVVLIGAELSYALQYMKVSKPTASRQWEVSPFMRKVCALFVMYRVLKAFRRNEEIPTTENLAQMNELPMFLINESINRLRKAGLINSVVVADDDKKNGEGAMGLQPAIEPDIITVQEVFLRLEKLGKDDAEIMDTPDELFQHMHHHVQKLVDQIRENGEDVPVYSLSLEERQSLQMK